jgi:hypothetical protein
VRRWWRRGQVEQRARLADDVRRLAGFADAAVTTAPGRRGARGGRRVRAGLVALDRPARHHPAARARVTPPSGAALLSFSRAH